MPAMSRSPSIVILWLRFHLDSAGMGGLDWDPPGFIADSSASC